MFIKRFESYMLNLIKGYYYLPMRFTSSLYYKENLCGDVILNNKKNSSNIL